MIGFDEAQRRLADAAGPLGSECVTLTDAHRRVLAEPVIAAVASPPCDVSSMDGYAVREADLGALPVTLPVVGESLPGGTRGGEVPSGTCRRIFTGAPLPNGADRVVVQEEVSRESEFAHFAAPLSPERFIRRAGSDFKLGETLIERGTLLTPGALVAAAAADRAEIAVFRRPRVRLIATGDELAEPGQVRARAGAIPDSVSIALAALTVEWGGEVIGTKRLGDDLPTLQRAAAAALVDADVVVVSGGASVGEKDFAKAMFEREGLELVFSKVSIKPGKPVWLGRARGKLVLGLPGNPTSALVTARLFLAPLLCGLSGRYPDAALDWRAMPIADALAPTGSRETFSRGYEEGDVARVFDHQDSSAQKLLGVVRLLVGRPPGDTPIAAGTKLQTLAL